MHLCAFSSAVYVPPSKTRAGAYYSLQTNPTHHINVRIHVMREYDIPRGAPRGRKELNR